MMVKDGQGDFPATKSPCGDGNLVKIAPLKRMVMTWGWFMDVYGIGLPGLPHDSRDHRVSVRHATAPQSIIQRTSR